MSQIPYKILSVMWNDDQTEQCVGVADFRVKYNDALIEIAVEGDGGARLYPNLYFMNRVKVRQYPTRLINGVNLHIIPIKDFEARSR